MSRISYSSQIARLAGHVSTMGHAVTDDVLAATHGVCCDDRDHGMAIVRDVIDGHAASERLNRSVEDTCMSLMLLEHPLAADLRLVTASFRAVTDLARIDEMAYQIALYAEEGLAATASLGDDLENLAAQAGRMVEKAIEAFDASDVAAAQDVFAMDDATDRMYEAVRADIVALLKRDDEAAAMAPELLTVAKYLERMGDHAQSIADWAIFRATGAYRGRPMGETQR